MHDALRADVLGATLAASTQDAAWLKRTAEETEEHIKEFNDNITLVIAQSPSPEITLKAKAIAEPLAAYTQGATALVRTVAAPASGPADKEAITMPVFLQLFSRLEDGMAVLTEKIDAESKAVNDSSTSGLTRSSSRAGSSRY